MLTLIHFRFDDSATPPQVNVNEDLELGETVVNVRAVPGMYVLSQFNFSNFVNSAYANE